MWSPTNAFHLRLLALYINNPFEYESLIKGYSNPKYCLRICNSFIPTDTGIEFEIGEALISHIRKKGLVHVNSSFECDIRLYKTYNLRKLYDFYRCICSSSCKAARYEQSGIHIHINERTGLIEQDKQSHKGYDSYRDFILYKLTYERPEDKAAIDGAVQYLANNYCKYTGEYNKNVFWYDSTKCYSLIYRFEYNTFEFRCFKMEWSFSQLLKHIILCHYFTDRLVKAIYGKITVKEFYNNIVVAVDALNSL